MRGRFAVLAVVAGCLVAPAVSRAAAVSTGTVVVAAPGAAAVWNVGTSTVTVEPGTTVAQLTAQLVASDGSAQTRAVVDAAGAAKPAGTVVAGDRLLVTAADGRTHGSYAVSVHDPRAAARDGEYWDERRYAEIDRTVNANTPVFPDRQCALDPALVRDATEVYADGNQAGDPANKTSPLVYKTQTVRYFGTAINAAIKACHDAGGGIVALPASDQPYYSGAITLLSGVNLRIETGATVKFMRNKTNAYYPVVRTSYEGTDLYNFSPLIYAYGQHDIAVTGGGTLDGQEDMWNWRPWKKGYWGEPNVEDRSLTATYGQQGVLNQMNFDDTPVETRIFSDDGQLPATIPVLRDGQVEQVPPPAGAKALKSAFRPAFIEPVESTNVLIEGVRIRNTPFWIVHPLSSRNVLLRDLDIYSNKTRDFESSGWNNDDGVDPESSQNVVMERNTVTVSDDGAAIKAGRNVNGRLHRAPSDGIIIRDSAYGNDGGGSAAISMGSEMSGGIRNVFVERNTFDGSGLAMLLKIKTNAYRGGSVDHIYVRDATVARASVALVQFDANYSETVSIPNADVFNPSVHDIYLDRVNTTPAFTAGRTTFSFPSATSRSPVENVFYRDSTVYTTGALGSAFSSNKNLKHFVVSNVAYINPATGAVTRYDTSPLELLDQTTADGVHVSEGALTRLRNRTFQLEGKTDRFPATAQMRVFVDRSTTPVKVTLRPDGTFVSDPITLDDNQYWYTDRHYLAVNVYDGININTAVYPVQVARAAVDTPGTVGATVPATLALTLGGPATFGAFTPGAEKTYTASTTATVTSTAGDASLTADGGRLTNGAFALAEPLQVAFSRSSWTGPVSNDSVTIGLTQHVGAGEALRTGSYTKTLTFTLSTTTP